MLRFDNDISIPSWLWDLKLGLLTNLHSWKACSREDQLVPEKTSYLKYNCQCFILSIFGFLSSFLNTMLPLCQLLPSGRYFTFLLWVFVLPTQCIAMAASKLCATLEYTEHTSKCVFKTPNEDVCGRKLHWYCSRISSVTVVTMHCGIGSANL